MAAVWVGKQAETTLPKDSSDFWCVSCSVFGSLCPSYFPRDLEGKGLKYPKSSCLCENSITVRGGKYSGCQAEEINIYGRGQRVM